MALPLPMMLAMMMVVDDDGDDDDMLLLMQAGGAGLAATIAAQERLAFVNMAQAMLNAERLSRPGRGFTTFGRPVSPPDIPPVDMRKIRWVVDGRAIDCIAAIGWTGKEFYHLLGFLQIEIKLPQHARGAVVRGGKYELLGRLYMSTPNGEGS